MKATASRIRNVIPVLAIVSMSIWLSACSMGQLVAQSAVPVMHGGLVAMNRETDIALAKDSMPANLKLVESLIVEAPNNRALKIYAATGFYSYAFGFIEDENPSRAADFYRRGFEYARSSLVEAGVKGDIQKMTYDDLKQELSQVDRDAVPELFWTAACWAKWIDMNRQDPARLAEIGKTAALMQRVLELDDTYYYGGAHQFFGVFYGNRSLLLGGNFKLAEQHFDKARALTQHKILMIDVLQAQYLEVQRHDRDRFHTLLTDVLTAPDDLDPDQALSNAIAKQKAKRLLEKEDQWF